MNWQRNESDESDRALIFNPDVVFTLLYFLTIRLSMIKKMLLMAV